MALVLADRVKETTTTTGTGTVTLAGVSAGYQSFAAIGDGNTTYYTISGQTTLEWEVGIGTYTSSGTTLSRTAVLSSSNGGSLVNFSAGTKDVFVTYPSGRSVNADAANTVVSVPQLSATSITDSGNLTFTGTGNRILGDFSNGTVANRPVFQSSTVNGATRVSLITNGTGVASELLVFNGSDPANAGFGSVRINASDFAIQALQNGTGTYLPINLVTNASNKLTIAADATGTYTFGGTAPRITGDFSNGTLTSRVAFQTSTANSSTNLHVLPSGTGTASGLKLEGDASMANGSRFTFDLVSGTDSRIGSGQYGTGTYLPMTFYTGGSERMRLDTSGNLGIGTSSPSTYGKFVVSGSSNAGVGTFIGNASLTGSAPTYQGSIRLLDNPTSATAASGGIEFLTSTFGSGYGWKMAAIDSSGVQLTFATRQNSASWTEAMRIDSSGNVVIGYTAASAKLHVVQNGTTYTSGLTISPSGDVVDGLSIYGNATNNPTAIIENVWDRTGTPVYSNIALNPSGGNVGVGTSSPTARLNVVNSANSGTATDNCSIVVSATNRTGFIQLDSVNGANGNSSVIFSAGGTEQGRILYKADSNHMYFSTATTERMRITSAGDVGIGTTAPGAKLEINGGALGGTSGNQTIIERLYGTVTNASYLDISLTRDSAGTSWVNAATRLQQKIDSTWMGFMQFNGTNNLGGITFGAGTSTVSATSIPEYMYLNSIGQVGIGTSAPTGKLDVRTAAGVVAQSNLYTGSNASVVKFNIGQVGAIDWDIGLSASAGNFYIGGLGGSMAEAYRITRTGTAIDFQTWNTGGSERMRIDSSGNVGIGTSSPSNKLQVSGDGARIAAQCATNNAAATTEAELEAQVYNYWGGTGGPTYTGTAIQQYGAVATGTIAGISVANLGVLRFQNGANGLIYTNGSTPLIFATNSTERMRIDGSGDLLVGGTTTGGRVTSISSTNDLFYGYNAAQKFAVTNGGTIFAVNTTISAISDIRYKENVRDLDVGLDKIMALKPRLYDWKEGKGADIKNARGFIAQEFEQVFPDLVDEWKDPVPEGEEPYKSVRQDLIPVLVKAIQEQQALITSLTARIEALESR